jgi:hypothetical protein
MPTGTTFNVLIILPLLCFISELILMSIFSFLMNHIFLFPCMLSFEFDARRCGNYFLSHLCVYVPIKYPWVLFWDPVKLFEKVWPFEISSHHSAEGPSWLCFWKIQERQQYGTPLFSLWPHHFHSLTYFFRINQYESNLETRSSWGLVYYPPKSDVAKFNSEFLNLPLSYFFLSLSLSAGF